MWACTDTAMKCCRYETTGYTPNSSLIVVGWRRHLCMVMRGVQKTQAKTITSTMLGVFRHDPKTREEFLQFIKT